MTDVASYINEYKRRKDLVSKYLEGDNTLMRKMAKLTMHSVAKKSSRLSAKLSASLGLTNLSVDPEFEELERQFKSLEKCTWQLSKDVEQCVNFLSDEAICGEIIADQLIQYYSGTPDSEIRRFRDTREMIRSQYTQNLRNCIDRRVNAPVNSLITLLEGPAVLITKRYDKLLDYDNAISRSEKNKESRIVIMQRSKFSQYRGKPSFLHTSLNRFCLTHSQYCTHYPAYLAPIWTEACRIKAFGIRTCWIGTCITDFAGLKRARLKRVGLKWAGLTVYRKLCR